ncbi:MAG: HlyD family secretion protein [Chitinophagales bacterium]|nr:HlyD family secretion protein [Chitinophagales bacterium]
MSEVNTTQQEGKKKTNKKFMIILAVVLAAGVIFGGKKIIHSMHHEDTDDAQVEADISPVIPRVSGYIKEVRVSDNQDVKKGDTLIILDDRDLQIQLAQAQAALESAKSNLAMAEATTGASKAQVASSQANVSTIDAQIETAKVNVWRATQDFKRYENLVKDHSITQQQYEQAQAQKETAEHQLQVLVEQKSAAQKQTSAAASQSNATSQQVNVALANVKQREADVANAELNLSYAVITASEDGNISKVPVNEGQLVQAGQTLFSIVAEDAVWVVANFKETQLEKMKQGQEVHVHVDAYPGHDFKGTISSFAPATGARFSLLPADNASGNFIKVVQRVPVKIEFTDLKDKMLSMLRAGMNVQVEVTVD